MIQVRLVSGDNQQQSRSDGFNGREIYLTVGDWCRA
jgi:hypothetical protein